MFVCIHYNRKATKIYKYVDMNIFVNFLLYLVVFYILYVIMEAEPKIFLNLLQFITITFTILYALLYCILCYQFISVSSSKFLIFTSRCSCPSIWNILFQSISYGLKSSYTSKSSVTLYFLFVT